MRYKEIRETIMIKWTKSWIKWFSLNLPYFKARLAGYNLYYRVGIDINPKPKTAVTVQQVQGHMDEIKADVRIVRYARRMSSRSFGYQLYATFKNEENAMAYKLVEGINTKLCKFPKIFLF
jgi:hypothetical protein